MAFLLLKSDATQWLGCPTGAAGGPRKILDLRPLSIGRWENEGGAVADCSEPVCERIPAPPRHRGLLTSGQTQGVV
jgi:hypothetical protein